MLGAEAGVDIALAEKLLPIGTWIETMTFRTIRRDVKGNPCLQTKLDWREKYVGEVVRLLDTENHHAEKILQEQYQYPPQSSRPCHSCKMDPHPIYVIYKNPKLTIHHGVHFYGEHDPRTMGMMIVKATPKITV